MALKMKEVPIAELTGPALDWAVAKAVGQEIIIRPVFGLMTPETLGWRPSTDWSQGGPLIDKFNPIMMPMWATDTDTVIGCMAAFEDVDEMGIPHYRQRGSTYLVAAMRAIVAKHTQADTVAVPLALVGGAA